ncbi:MULTISPECIES: hypothetical protein [Salinispora]|uniref:hypothetical protein n=1 Tax=Salinispora TaxID=168694 RepID=UPI000376BE21|nr:MULTISPECIES: hypothetical protein [Salinispora]NYT95677.1 hypothetical protein [Salinispora sp. H7-4]
MTTFAPVYLPLWDEPIQVEAGDVMEVEFVRALSGDGVHPDYSAVVRLTTSEGCVEATASSPYEPAGFRQGWFYRELFTARRRSVQGPADVAAAAGQTP